MEGYYPGELTVQLTGTVVIEAGGSLTISTLSIGGPEARPVITGTGRIVVKAGGQLRLTCADFAPQGQDPMIVQEAGGSVELADTAADQGVFQWSVPLVNNLYDAPEDIWLETGTALTADLLPAVMRTEVQSEGREEEREVPLSWDWSGYDGRTGGELVLSGTFLDEAGLPLASLLPLELTVHWYTPGTLVVTDARWKGDTVPAVQLIVQELPEDADIWGEVSVDEGGTWTRWENDDRFFIMEVEGAGWACIFSVSEEMSGLFRVAAQDLWDPHTCWRSEAFFLSPPEDGEDSGGNRGGSTAPDPPEREPEPADRPGREPEDADPDHSAPPQTGHPVQDPVREDPGELTETGNRTPAEDPAAGPAEDSAVPGPGGEIAVPDPGADAAPETPRPQADSGSEMELFWKIPDRLPAAASEQPAGPDTAGEDRQASGQEAAPDPEELTQERPAPAEPAEPEPAGPPSALAQILLAAAGIALCAGGGMAAAGVGPFKRNRE